MSGKVEFVDFRESVSIKVGRYLISKGFIPASPWGEKLIIEERLSTLGVLYNDPDAKERRYFFGLIKKEPRLGLLGAITFDIIARTNEKDEPFWKFEIYGSKCVDMAKNLAEDLSSVFNVNIRLYLMSEEPREEMFSNEDYGL
ncbi:hypothetical protein A2W13_00240 [Candidatus Woesebacteria bacterium RBG_16_36_11]|uniref:Uncharacterized protein n=1 Tax=Candidatus Woesebacteria bacterium RBG_16_36_11 TaxID=1802481 RepID=A0A1F7X716_9BACT|nr:MAG: hypothetical protein A2W13_00240 [Candidatus Woesebacteria bacterium RBG_16_36_11]